jgi:hypothetical protein
MNEPQKEQSKVSTGSAYFVSYQRAIDYYETQGIEIKEVRLKIAAGEIHIGAPKLEPGQESVLDLKGRYLIQDSNDF